MTPPPPAAAAIFARATRAMAAQAAPASVLYDETVTREGLGVRIVQSGGNAVVHLAFSSSPGNDLFQVRGCGAATTLFDVAGKRRYTSELPFWSPFWPSTATVTSVLGVTRARMEADLREASGNAYAATLGAPATIDGGIADHLLLAAQNPSLHPLTDLYVDEQSGLVLRAVAAFKDTSVTDVTGSVTLNFARDGTFWIADSGEIDATVHAYFRRVSGSATFSTSNLRFDACRT